MVTYKVPKTQFNLALQLTRHSPKALDAFADERVVLRKISQWAGQFIGLSPHSSPSMLKMNLMEGAPITKMHRFT